MTWSANDGGDHHLRGYRRENGRVGVRNHGIILPLDDLSNAACEAVAAARLLGVGRCGMRRLGCGCRGAPAAGCEEWAVAAA